MNADYQDKDKNICVYLENPRPILMENECL